jgi:hypothetical protein
MINPDAICPIPPGFSQFTMTRAEYNLLVEIALDEDATEELKQTGANMLWASIAKRLHLDADSITPAGLIDPHIFYAKRKQ